MSSMLYTVGTALDRAASSGVTVSVLVNGAWIDGQIAAVDRMGVVLEGSDGNHAPAGAHLRGHGALESPFRAQLARELTEAGDVAATVPGPRTP